MKGASNDVLWQLKGLPQAYLDCRDLGHAYGHPVTLKDPASTGSKLLVERVVPCTRCPVTRTEHYQVRTYRGQQYLVAVKRPTVKYPSGYRISGMPQGHSRALARSEAITRALRDFETFDAEVARLADTGNLP